MSSTQTTSENATQVPSAATVDLKLEVVAIPVSDIDRAKAFYMNLGWSLDADFMIRRLPGVFAAGEMLDWEAPTGGYLLQASFATGAAARRGALKYLGAK